MHILVILKVFGDNITKVIFILNFFYVTVKLSGSVNILAALIIKEINSITVFRRVIQLFYKFIHPFIHPFVRSFIPSFVRSFIHSFVHHICIAALQEEVLRNALSISSIIMLFPLLKELITWMQTYHYHGCRDLWFNRVLILFY